jgi:hypothetical protein
VTAKAALCLDFRGQPSLCEIRSEGSGGVGTAQASSNGRMSVEASPYSSKNNLRQGVQRGRVLSCTWKGAVMHMEGCCHAHGRVLSCTWKGAVMHMEENAVFLFSPCCSALQCSTCADVACLVG